MGVVNHWSYFSGHSSNNSGFSIGKDYHSILYPVKYFPSLAPRLETVVITGRGQADSLGSFRIAVF
jgi:hypothetical protein